MGHTFSPLSNAIKLLLFSIIMDMYTFHVSGIGQNRLDQIGSLDFIITSITMLVTKRPWFCVVKHLKSSIKIQIWSIVVHYLIFLP
jgi:hypothetical protein